MYSSLSTAILATSIVMPVLATVAVFLRLYARYTKSVSLMADDWVILVDLVLVITLGVLAAWGSVNGGIGDPLQDLTPDLAVVFLKLLFWGNFLYILAVGLVKISIVLFYRRIFPTPAFKLAVNVMLFLITGWIIAFLFSSIFSTDPVSTQWTGIGKRTLNFATILIATVSTDIAIDLLTLCLPLPMIRNLNMSPARKRSVAAILWLGAFCCVSSMVRLNYIVQFAKIYDHPDEAFSSATTHILIWSQIETCTSIIAACLPTLGPLFRGGRGVESLIASIRSYLSSRGSLSLSSEKRKRSQDSDTAPVNSREAAAAWERIQPGTTGKTKREEMELNGMGSRDLESQKRTFTVVES